MTQLQLLGNWQNWQKIHALATIFLDLF